MTTPSGIVPPRPLWMRCLLISTRIFRPSPRVERYLGLLCGVIIITVTCRVWYALQMITTDLGIWSGPDDPYLLQFRSGTAWLWRHDPYGVALLAWAAIGIVALGPLTSPAWRNSSWPTVTWGIATLVACFIYVSMGVNLMMLPLGRFG